jgi:hypothetical protein
VLSSRGHVHTVSVRQHPRIMQNGTLVTIASTGDQGYVRQVWANVQEWLSDENANTPILDLPTDCECLRSFPCETHSSEPVYAVEVNWQQSVGDVADSATASWAPVPSPRVTKVLSARVLVPCLVFADAILYAYPHRTESYLTLQALFSQARVAVLESGLAISRSVSGPGSSKLAAESDV